METTTIKSKTCTKCKELKELSMFSKKSYAKDNLQSRCKVCEKQYRDENKDKYKLWREENSEKLSAKKKEYRLLNIDNILDKAKKYREANIEKVAQDSKEYRKNNKEKISTYQKQHNIKNRESKKKYREINKKRIAKCVKDWSATKKGKISKVNSESKRRMLKISKSNGTIPKDIVFPLTDILQDMLINQGYSCKYCGLNIEKENMHLDHIKPLAKGGMHSIDNVQWLCQTCNLQKGSKLEHDFLMGKSFSISLS